MFVLFDLVYDCNSLNQLMVMMVIIIIMFGIFLRWW